MTGKAAVRGEARTPESALGFTAHTDLKHVPLIPGPQIPKDSTQSELQPERQSSTYLGSRGPRKPQGAFVSSSALWKRRDWGVAGNKVPASISALGHLLVVGGWKVLEQMCTKFT